MLPAHTSFSMGKKIKIQILVVCIHRSVVKHFTSQVYLEIDFEEVLFFHLFKLIT